MEKIEIEVGWNHKESAEVLTAYDGHYKVEFTFNKKRFYLVGNYKEDGATDIRVYNESEFLLADEPEEMYSVRDGRENGRLPFGGMYVAVYEAMKYGRKTAESGVAHFKLGW